MGELAFALLAASLPRAFAEGITPHHEDCPQKALCGGIPGAVLEPLVRSWSHFVGICRQTLTRSLEN